MSFSYTTAVELQIISCIENIKLNMVLGPMGSAYLLTVDVGDD